MDSDRAPTKRLRRSQVDIVGGTWHVVVEDRPVRGPPHLQSEGVGRLCPGDQERVARRSIESGLTPNLHLRPAYDQPREARRRHHLPVWKRDDDAAAENPLLVLRAELEAGFRLARRNPATACSLSA